MSAGHVQGCGGGAGRGRSRQHQWPEGKRCARGEGWRAPAGQSCGAVGLRRVWGFLPSMGGVPGGSLVKNPPAMQETQV